MYLKLKQRTLRDVITAILVSTTLRVKRWRSANPGGNINSNLLQYFLSWPTSTSYKKNGCQRQKIQFSDTINTNLSKRLLAHLLKCQNYCIGNWSREWRCVSTSLRRRIWRSLYTAQRRHPYSGSVEQLQDQRKDPVKWKMRCLTRLGRETKALPSSLHRTAALSLSL